MWAIFNNSGRCGIDELTHQCKIATREATETEELVALRKCARASWVLVLLAISNVAWAIRYVLDPSAVLLGSVNLLFIGLTVGMTLSVAGLFWCWRASQRRPGCERDELTSLRLIVSMSKNFAYLCVACACPLIAGGLSALLD
jgi:hypothetical protein